MLLCWSIYMNVMTIVREENLLTLLPFLLYNHGNTINTSDINKKELSALCLLRFFINHPRIAYVYTAQLLISCNSLYSINGPLILSIQASTLKPWLPFIESPLCSGVILFTYNHFSNTFIVLLYLHLKLSLTNISLP